MRKNAKQARARRTIEIILEATTQLLETQNVDQVYAAFGAEIVNREDVGVRQGGDGLGLSLEASQALAVQHPGF